MTVTRLSEFPYVEARNFTRVPGVNIPVTRIVIHDMEMADTGTTAESCAQMFHKTTRQASAHFTVDNNSIVQCVPLDCIAWHAPPNTGSIGIEHAGYASETRGDWLDDYNMAMLRRSAELTARLCFIFGIPIVKLSPLGLLTGKRGICGHADVSAAWKQSDHTDPGANFPWDVYIGLVNTYATQEETPVTQDEIAAIASAVWNRFTITSPDGSEIHLVDAVERLLKDAESKP